MQRPHLSSRTRGKVANEGVWWLGFDCAHHGDLVPDMTFMSRGVYRNIAYVEQE